MSNGKLVSDATATTGGDKAVNHQFSTHIPGEDLMLGGYADTTGDIDPMLGSAAMQAKVRRFCKPDTST